MKSRFFPPEMQTILSLLKYFKYQNLNIAQYMYHKCVMWQLTQTALRSRLDLSLKSLLEKQMHCCPLYQYGCVWRTSHHRKQCTHKRKEHGNQASIGTENLFGRFQTTHSCRIMSYTRGTLVKPKCAVMNQTRDSECQYCKESFNASCP